MEKRMDTQVSWHLNFSILNKAQAKAMSEPSSSVVVLLLEIIVYLYFLLVIIHSKCMFGGFDNIDPFSRR